MKKILLILLSFMSVISISFVDVSAEDSEFIYSIIDNEICIRYYTGTETNIVIPEEIDGIPVTMIDDSFIGLDVEEFESITLTKNIKQISGFYIDDWGEYIYAPFVFAYVKEFIVDEENPYFASYDGAIYSKDFTYLYRCPSFRSTIDLKSGLETIGYWAFCETQYESITFPSTLKEIEGYEYFNSLDLYYLEEINVEEGNERFFSNDGALYEINNGQIILVFCPPAKDTTSFIVAEGTDKIAFSAFYNENLLIDEIIIPDSVLEIVLKTENFWQSSNIINYTWVVNEGSYAHNIAIENGISYRLMEEVELGDVNLDGVIDYSDAVLILRSDSQSYVLDELQKQYADVTFDGIINYNDAVQILKRDAGLIEEF